jgi:hypothetical protein
LIGNAPVGHRQPHASDIPSENTNDLEHIVRRMPRLIAGSKFAADAEAIGVREQ